MYLIRVFFFLIVILILSSPNAFSMHISEGILPFRWAFIWYLAAIPFIIKGIFGIKKKARIVPQFKVLLGLMGAVVFIISCMPVPVPTAGTCSHPAGTGISAILIGPVMSVFVTSIVLFIQALFLAHGGITTWGADIASMGIAGSFAGYFAFKILRSFKAPLFVSGFAAGLLADWATYITTSFELASALHGSKPLFSLFATVLFAFIPTQLPLGILEGFITGGIIVFVYKRRPDILISLNVIKDKSEIRNPKSETNYKSQTKILLFIICALSFVLCSVSFAENKWTGVDENVVEKIAAQHGRTAWAPFINTDQGDLLLFVFLLAGLIGGFILGYLTKKLFFEKKEPEQ